MVTTSGDLWLPVFWRKRSSLSLVILRKSFSAIRESRATPGRAPCSFPVSMTAYDRPALFVVDVPSRLLALRFGAKPLIQQMLRRHLPAKQGVDDGYDEEGRGRRHN